MSESFASPADQQAPNQSAAQPVDQPTDEGATSAAPAQPAAPAAQPAPQEFTMQAGDRTFKSQEDVVNHIQHSQSHIATLEAENADLRSQLADANAKLGELDDLKQQVNDLMKQMQSEPTDQQQSSQTGPISTEEVVKAVKGELQAEQQATIRETNFAKAKEAAQAKWGDEYLTKVQERASAIGLSVEDVDDMAKNKPAAFQSIILEQAPQAAQERPSPFADSSVKPPSGQQQPQPKPATPFSKMSMKDRAAEVQRRLEAAQS
jgi:hypothetical protein